MYNSKDCLATAKVQPIGTEVRPYARRKENEFEAFTTESNSGNVLNFSSQCLCKVTGRSFLVLHKSIGLR
jgi:hypothetical protein